MRISDWSSDVCSSDLLERFELHAIRTGGDDIADHVPRRDDPFDRPRMRNPHHRSARDRGLDLNAHPHIVLTQHAGAERDEFLALMLIGVNVDRDVDLYGPISVTPDEEAHGARIDQKRDGE